MSALEQACLPLVAGALALPPAEKWGQSCRHIVLPPQTAEQVGLCPNPSLPGIFLTALPRLFPPTCSPNTPASPFHCHHPGPTTSPSHPDITVTHRHPDITVTH